MNAFDYIVIAILGVSVLMSIWRGAVRELMSLAGWVAAFFAAQAYAQAAAAFVPAPLQSPSLRMLAGFVAVFASVLIVSTVAALLLSRLLRAVGLGPADRMLGGVIGFLRGMLITLVLVLLGGLTTVPREPVWREAMLSAPLEAAALVVRTYLPAALAERITFDDWPAARGAVQAR